MRNKDIKEVNVEEKLNSAFDKVTPNVLEAVISDFENESTIVRGEKIFMKKNNSRSRMIKGIAGIAAALMLASGGSLVYARNYAVASTVSLDVNPAVEIKTNSKENVLSVTAVNEDGVNIIGGMDFKGSSIEVTVNALIGSMFRNGYLTELANAVLITVEDGNTARAEELQKKLADEVNGMLQTAAFSGAVLSQTVTNDVPLRDMAEKYGITQGKAQLINELTAANPIHTSDELASLSVNELLLLKTSVQAEDKSTLTGDVSDKAYIGAERAVEIALEHAGVSAENAAVFKTEFDYEKGVFVYDIEFYSDGYEYDYDISAVDGTVVKFDKELEDDMKLFTTDLNKTVDLSENPDVTAQPVIDAETAKSTALNHAGVSADNIRDFDIELEREHGKFVYEIDFDCDGYEYEYDIDALSGEILKNEKERD